MANPDSAAVSGSTPPSTRESWSTRRTLLIGSALLGGAALSSGACAAAPDERFQGVWTGVLVAGSLRARLRLEITADGQATIISLDENGQASVSDRAVFEGDSVDLEFLSVSARYRGRLAGDRIEGQWRQMRHQLPLTFVRGEGVDEQPTPVSVLTPEMLRTVRRTARIPAMGAGWATRGGQHVVLVDGLRSSEADVAVTPGDRWHLGSITKSMTSTLLALGVEAGMIRWSDTVGGVLGAGAPRMRDEYRDVTLLHLLSHRAGLPGDIPGAEAAEFGRAETADPREDRLQYVRLALAQNPVATPGERTAYSNSGYVVAGAMLEARTGEPWETMMRKHLFAPLALDSAGFGAPGVQGLLDEPLGHYEPAFTWKDGRGRNPVPPQGRRPADNIVALGPAGRVHMSMDDLLLYLEAHRDLRPDLLTAENWRILHTPPFGGTYALGWETRQDGGLWHNGSNTLWYAEVSVRPGAGSVAASVANDGLQDLTFPIVGRILLAAEAAALGT